MRSPVWPIWSACGRQPRLVTTREPPTAPPSREASSSSCAKPAAEPTPRPPPTTTFASASETPLVLFGSRPTTRPTRSSGARSGVNRSTGGVAAPLDPISTATACGATVISRTGASSAASSRRLPAQRWRTRCHDSPGLTSTTFAAIGSPARAATWASTSFPRSLPAATTADAARASMTSRIDAAQAAGAYSSSRSSSARWALPTPYVPSRAATGSAFGPMSTASIGTLSPSARPFANESASSDSRSASAPTCSTSERTGPLIAASFQQPDPGQQVDHRRRRLRPMAEDRRGGVLLRGESQAELRRPRHGVDRRPVLARPEPDRARRRAAERDPLDLLLLRPQPARHGRVPRQFEALLHAEDGRERQLVRLPAAARRLPPREDRATIVAEPQLLDPADDRPAQRHGDAHADLVVARVGRLVAEHDQVEGAVDGLLRLDRLLDRGRRRDGIPLAAVRLEQDRAVDADRHRVAELLLGRRGPERQHGRRAALLLDDPDRLLDAALLVRADRVAEEPGVDRLPVRGQDDAPSRLRHALHTDEDVHDRMRMLSGSKSGVEPATATVTGYCSPRYSTSSGVPALATSGGR